MSRPSLTGPEERRDAKRRSRGQALGEPDSSAYQVDDPYTATDQAQAHDTSIRATDPLPNGLQINPGTGQSVYVAEVYRKRRDIVPLAGVDLPDSLYSAAYF